MFSGLVNVQMQVCAVYRGVGNIFGDIYRSGARLLLKGQA
jgi:hypothetical protein